MTPADRAEAPRGHAPRRQGDPGIPRAVNAPSEGAGKAHVIWIPLAVLVLAQIGTTSDNAAMNIAVGSLATHLGATLGDIQMATTVFSLIAGAFMIAGGLVGITIGLVRTMRIGLALAIIGEILAATAPTMLVLTWGGRIIMGLGACLVTPSVLGLVPALWKGRQRAVAFGAIAGAAAISTLSPLILGAVMDIAGFRLVFAGLACYFAVVLLATKALPSVSPTAGRARFDAAGTVVAAAGLTLLLLGISRLSTWGVTAPLPSCPFTLAGFSPALPCALAGVLLLLILVPVERRAARLGNPLLPSAYVASPSVRAGLLAVAAPFFFMGAQGILITPYLMLVAGFTAFEAGLLSLLSGVPMFLLATFLPKLTPSVSSRLIIRSGFITLTASSLLMASGITEHGASPLLFVGTCLGGFGVGAVNSQANNAVASALSGKAAEQSGGIQGAARNIGLALGTAVAGTCLLLALGTGFASHAAEHGLPEATMRATAEFSNTLMTEESFSTVALDAGASEEEAAALARVRSASQTRALRLTFGLLGALMGICLFGTRRLVNTAENLVRSTPCPRHAPR